MRTAKVVEGRKCPMCGRVENQRNAGKNRSGTQRCYCTVCKKGYTFNSKMREYPEEVKEQAIKALYSGTLDAVLSVFIDAYNKYGEAKEKYRQRSTHKSTTNTRHLHEYKDPPFSILDFL